MVHVGELDHHALTFVIRWLHVVAMAVAVGGALLVAALAFAPRAGDDGRGVLETAARYEWTFWVAAGVIVMTGVGNLGAFGRALPPPTSTWGATLDLKLVAVAALLAASLPRSLVVAELARGQIQTRVMVVLRAAYGGTATVLAAILGLAVFLAHG
jgi:hypothetical protein